MLSRTNQPAKNPRGYTGNYTHAVWTKTRSYTFEFEKLEDNVSKVMNGTKNCLDTNYIDAF